MRAQSYLAKNGHRRSKCAGGPERLIDDDARNARGTKKNSTRNARSKCDVLWCGSRAPALDNAGMSTSLAPLTSVLILRKVASHLRIGTSQQSFGDIEERSDEPDEEWQWGVELHIFDDSRCSGMIGAHRHPGGEEGYVGDSS